ncbi:hypothetical protein CEXT_75531 [Caerostris extrusa]|uniref:Uncharacterized protein n=1 Tax=Caerostris extrusa TaxID=172846 RepID=A0AAV4XT31_CAEEX|nr:hypothetical protein CEXT_75531 [Caerostris extrusa]
MLEQNSLKQKPHIFFTKGTDECPNVVADEDRINWTYLFLLRQSVACLGPQIKEKPTCCFWVCSPLCLALRKTKEIKAETTIRHKVLWCPREIDGTICLLEMGKSLGCSIFQVGEAFDKSFTADRW